LRSVLLNLNANHSHLYLQTKKTPATLAFTD
jgi:hypothetical protein